MRGFWNDKNGLTIKDFTYLIFSLSYVFMVGFMSYCMIRGIDIKPSYIDIFETLTYPILIILGGQFTHNLAEVITNRPKPMSTKVKKEVSKIE
ncbi:hypothetical protein LIS04_90 [Listeria phage LIS04]|nr:hypothetical protein LIS04_90 [Listeria phage LIS04]